MKKPAPHSKVPGTPEAAMGAGLLPRPSWASTGRGYSPVCFEWSDPNFVVK